MHAIQFQTKPQARNLMSQPGSRTDIMMGDFADVKTSCVTTKMVNLAEYEMKMTYEMQMTNQYSKLGPKLRMLNAV